MQQTKSIDLRRRRDIGGLVTVTFDFVRLNFRQLGRAILFIAGPPIALVAVLSGVMFADMLDMSTYDPETMSPFAGMFTRVATSVGLGYLVAAILLAVVNSYMLIYLERKGEGEIEVAEVRQKLFENFGMVIGTLLVTTIITFIGFIVLIVPGVYLSVALSIILAVRMVEGRGLVESIRRCTALMTGYWWMTLGLIIVMSIITAALGWVVSIPQYIVMMVYGITVADGETASSSYRIALIVTSIIQAFGSNLLNAILIIAVTINYFNLVERKEGVGSMARIEEIGASADAESL
jgi:hypothetical protein